MNEINNINEKTENKVTEIHIPDITEQLVENNIKKNKIQVNEFDKITISEKPISRHFIETYEMMPIEKKTKHFRFLKNDRKPIINLKRFRKKGNKAGKSKEESEDEFEKQQPKNKEPNKIRHHLKRSCKIS